MLSFPVWNYGYPAILKGFFDRVFLPGVSFKLVDGKVAADAAQHPQGRGGHHLWRQPAARHADGRSAAQAGQAGAARHREAGRVGLHQALYAMNVASEARRRRFIAAVAARMEAF